MGYVFRPAPTVCAGKFHIIDLRNSITYINAMQIGELRSGSPRLLELNEFIRQRYSKGFLDVLSFSEVT